MCTADERVAPLSNPARLVFEHKRSVIFRKISGQNVAVGTNVRLVRHRPAKTFAVRNTLF